MKSFMSLMGGAVASALLAIAASAHMGPRLDARIAHAPAVAEGRTSTAVVAPAVAATGWPASQPVLGSVGYGVDATATGGPSGRLPDRK